MPRGLLGNLFFRAADGTEAPVDVEGPVAAPPPDPGRAADEPPPPQQAPPPPPTQAPIVPPGLPPQAPPAPAPPPAGPPAVPPIPGVTSPPAQRARPGAAPADPRDERIRALEERLLVADAQAWADGEIEAERSLPTDRAALVAGYILAARDDLADPSSFAALAGIPAFAAARVAASSRVEFLKASHQARPKHYLFREFIGADLGRTDVVAIRPDPKPADGAADPKEVDRLRGLNPTLAAAAAARAGRGPAPTG